jgi:hypothetical protein
VSDPDFESGGRETLYYARAFEAPAPTVNAGGMRCERDAQGNCTRVKMCAREDPSEDCLAPEEPRAWSSPIWVTPAPAETTIASGEGRAQRAESERSRTVAAVPRRSFQ